MGFGLTFRKKRHIRNFTFLNQNTKLKTDHIDINQIDLSQINDDVDISDLISDDYLIDDIDDINDDNEIDNRAYNEADNTELRHNGLNMMIDRASPNDINQITRMMLGIK